MTNTNDILFNVTDGIAWLTINRPNKMNSVTAAMAGEIKQYCKQIDIDDDIRVLVITGTGDRAFSAGSDINALDDLGTPWEQRNRAQYDKDYVEPLLNLRKPIIAAIDGYCLGGGLEIAICADIRIGTTRSNFGAPEIRHGWHAGSGNVSILPRLIGYANAGRWILTGDIFPAEEAYRVGFLQELVSPEALVSFTNDLAQGIVSKSPLAVQSAKNIIKQSQGTSLMQGLAWENDGYTFCMSTEDAQEGQNAFAEKRKPVFKGR